MTQSMLDRIADAIIDGTNSNITWAMAQNCARAALTAMLEPSDAMIEAGYYHANWTRDDCPEEARKESVLCWRTMIQAILNEGAEK